MISSKIYVNLSLTGEFLVEVRQPHTHVLLCSRRLLCFNKDKYTEQL